MECSVYFYFMIMSLLLSSPCSWWQSHKIQEDLYKRQTEKKTTWTNRPLIFGENTCIQHIWWPPIFTVTWYYNYNLNPVYVFNFFLIHKIAQSITNIHTGSIHNLGIWSIYWGVSGSLPVCECWKTSYQSLGFLLLSSCARLQLL